MLQHEFVTKYLFSIYAIVPIYMLYVGRGIVHICIIAHIIVKQAIKYFIYIRDDAGKRRALLSKIKFSWPVC